MISKVEALFDFSKVGCIFSQSDLSPQSLLELFPIFGHFTPESEHKLGKTYQIGALLVKNVEDHIDLSISDVDPLIFYHLFELLVVQKSIPIDISLLHCLLKH